MRLLVVEDDHSLAQGLRDGLTAERFAVDCAANVATARECLELNSYDLVLLDLTLPDADGLTLMKLLREEESPVPILVITARGNLADRVAGLNAGADDYLLKPFAFPELVARIQALLRRSLPTVPTVLRAGDLALDPVRFEVRRAGIPLSLTVKEFTLLEYLMRHAGELVTRTMLLEHCWDSTYEGVSNLIDVHMGRLRRKLDAAGPAILQTVRGAGYILGSR